MNEVINTSPAISIIVPIYNKEELMRKCLDSIMAQTFQDYECLLIDDGSKDGSPAICDEYAVKDSRFKAFHKENGGVSSTRQFGIDHACGEYTIHADPDDWVEPTMLEELYRKAKEDDADMVICDFYENTYKGQVYIRQRPSALDHNSVLNDLFHHLHGSTCNKLVKRNSYSEYGIRFPQSIHFCEDLYVNAALLKNNIRVSYLNMAFYHYVRNSQDSLSRRYDENSEKQNVDLRNLFMELFNDSKMSDMVNGFFSYTIVYKAFWGGKSYYSSKKFKVKYYQYIGAVEASANTVEKYLLLLSCRGWYHPVIECALWGLKARSWFIRTIKQIV